jgi:hypothetical protein
MSDPHAQLDRSRWLWSIVGVVTCAAALTAIGIWATSFSPAILAGGSLAAFTGLEVGVQRSGAARRAPVKRLMHALIEQVDQPQVEWMRGLPVLRGLVDGRAFALSVDPAGTELRLGLTIAAQPHTPVFLASRHPQDYPEKIVTRLLTKGGYVVFDADGDDLTALCFKPDEAEGYAIEAVRPVLDANAPFCTTLDAGFETIRWDSVLTERVTPEMLIDLVRTLPPRFAGPPQAEDPLSPVEPA